MDIQEKAAPFAAGKRTIVVFDLAGFARAFQEKSDEAVAAFCDRYYALCERVIAEAGGQIVKFMGDGGLAVFGEEQAEAAVAACVNLGAEVVELARELGFDFSLGANVHLAHVVEAELGSGPSRRRDLIGRGVNQTFLLGRGPGIRLSEPVYRKLPSAARSHWTKHKPPAVYSFGAGGEPYRVLGKDPATNALRW